MTWEEALTYDSLIKDVAHEWAHRINDPSLEGDIVNHLYIRLVKKVKTDNARDKTQYVRAALWKQAEKFVRSHHNHHKRRNHLRLDKLIAQGVQIDTQGNVYWPDSFVEIYSDDK